MSIVGFIIVVGLCVVAYAAYQLYKAKKAVTVANIVAQAKIDESNVKADIKRP